MLVRFLTTELQRELPNDTLKEAQGVSFVSQGKQIQLASMIMRIHSCPGSVGKGSGDAVSCRAVPRRGSHLALLVALALISTPGLGTSLSQRRGPKKGGKKKEARDHSRGGCPSSLGLPVLAQEEQVHGERGQGLCHNHTQICPQTTAGEVQPLA